MTVKEILVKWLKENGYDGLCYFECGCGIDDCMPCGEPNLSCEAAYKWSKSPDPEFDEWYCTEKEYL